MWIKNPTHLKFESRTHALLKNESQKMPLKFESQKVKKLMDSGFKFKMGRILDSDLGLQGLITIMYPLNGGII